MDVVELRKYSKDELLELEQRMLKQLFQFKFNNLANHLNDTSQIRKNKRTIARIKSIIQELNRSSSVNIKGE